MSLCYIVNQGWGGGCQRRPNVALKTPLSSKIDSFSYANIQHLRLFGDTVVVDVNINKRGVPFSDLTICHLLEEKGPIRLIH